MREGQVEPEVLYCSAILYEKLAAECRHRQSNCPKFYRWIPWARAAIINASPQSQQAGAWTRFHNRWNNNQIYQQRLPVHRGAFVRSALAYGIFKTAQIYPFDLSRYLGDAGGPGENVSRGTLIKNADSEFVPGWEKEVRNDVSRLVLRCNVKENCYTSKLRLKDFLSKVGFR